MHIHYVECCHCWGNTVVILSLYSNHFVYTAAYYKCIVTICSGIGHKGGAVGDYMVILLLQPRLADAIYTKHFLLIRTPASRTPKHFAKSFILCYEYLFFNNSSLKYLASLNFIFQLFRRMYNVLVYELQWT